MVDNLDKVERLGWIQSMDSWLETRQLRNQMVQTSIENPEILLNALTAGHEFVSLLSAAAEKMLNEIEVRVGYNKGSLSRFLTVK